MLESRDYLATRVMKLAATTLTLVNFMLAVTAIHYFVWLFITLIKALI